MLPQAYVPSMPAPEAATVGLCLRYGHIWSEKVNFKIVGEKIPARLITFPHDKILTNVFLRLTKSCGTRAQIWIFAVSRDGGNDRADE